MFNISDRVQHKQTGDVGMVVGYGYRMVNNNYWTTIKVKSTDPTSLKGIIEDLFNEWLLCQEDDNILTLSKLSRAF